MTDDCLIHHRNSIFDHPGDCHYHPFRCFRKVVTAVSGIYMECNNQSLFRRLFLGICWGYSANNPFNKSFIKRNYLSKYSTKFIIFAF